MEKSWVMTEEERLQMLKARLEKRQKQESTSSSSDVASPTSSSPSATQMTKFKHDRQPVLGISANQSRIDHNKVNGNSLPGTVQQFLSISPPTKDGHISSSSSSSTVSASSSPSSSASFFHRSSSFGSNSTVSNPSTHHYEPDITKLAIFLDESEVIISYPLVLVLRLLFISRFTNCWSILYFSASCFNYPSRKK